MEQVFSEKFSIFIFFYYRPNFLGVEILRLQYL
jgi:hypothetical protein